jgi:hypothetical protein
MSNIGRTEATAITHEWLTETLAAPTLPPSFWKVMTSPPSSTANQPARFGNLCQINGKKYGVSGTEQAVKSAGNSGSLPVSASSRAWKPAVTPNSASLATMPPLRNPAPLPASRRRSGRHLVQRLAGRWRFGHGHLGLDLDRCHSGHHAHLHRTLG